MRIFVLIGPPSCGKGTQAKNIQSRFQVKHVSTGTLIREEIAKESTYGKKLQQHVNDGELIPDDLIQELLQKIILESSQDDILLIDGFPRTIGQVTFFLNFLREQEFTIEKMIILAVTNQELERRKEKRRMESSRSDDKIEIQNHRAIVYKEQTIPAIEELKIKVSFCEILAEGTISGISDKIIKCMEL